MISDRGRARRYAHRKVKLAGLLRLRRWLLTRGEVTPYHVARAIRLKTPAQNAVYLERPAGQPTGSPSIDLDRRSLL